VNIFFLDRNPKKAAEALRDNHVTKMPSECGQLLSAWADWYVEQRGNIDLPEFPRMDYPKSVPEHPCCLWLKEGLENVRWMILNLKALHEEYDVRYGKPDKYIKSRAMVDAMLPWFDNFVMLNWTAPKQALGPNGHLYYVEPRTTDNAVLAYRRYYVAEKLPDANYTAPSSKPDWPPYEPPPPPKAKIKASSLRIGKPPEQTKADSTTGVSQVGSLSRISQLKIKRK